MKLNRWVYIVDDDRGVRAALTASLESAGLQVRSFASAEDFEGEYEGETGCLLLDLRLEGISGVQLLNRLREAGHGLPVIMFSGHADIPVAVECMRLGAVDFLQKPIDVDALLAKLRGILDQLQRDQHSIARVQDAKARIAALTPREREMLQMLIEGKSSKQIASEKKLSLRTVNNHRTHLLAKTGAENTADLVRLALTSGLFRTA